MGRIDKSSVAGALEISDGSWSRSSWIANFWTRQPDAGESDIRKKNVLVLVCGPERYVALASPPTAPADQIPITITRMVAMIAGPYGKNYSQGKVGGVLAELGFKAGQVWKL
jgi:cytochrome-b5 reductase